MSLLTVARTLTCRYCGAPLQAGPDDILVVCRRCGHVNWLKGASAPVLAVQALSKNELEAKFNELMARDPDVAKSYAGIARIETVYFPFYAGRARGVIRYEAEAVVTKTETRCRGDRCTTVTRSREVVVRGEVRGTYYALIPARRAVGDRVISQVASRVVEMYRRGSLSGPDAIDWGRADEVLAPEMSVEEAGKRLRGEACEALLEEAEEDARRRARREAGLEGGSVVIKRMTAPCDISDARVEYLVYAPYSRVYYVAGDAVYRAYLYGWNGEPIEREEPFTDTQRMLVSAISGLLAAGGWSLAAHLALSDGTVGLLAGLFSAIASLLAARDLYYGAANLLYRVERGRGGSWLETLPATLSAILRLRGTILSRLMGGE